MPKDLDYIARLERAISRKYGNEAILNPMANWSEEKKTSTKRRTNRKG
jgi:hypothetical protein